MKRFLFVIGLFILFYQIGLSASIDSLKWIEMPVRTYPDYPVQIIKTDSLRFFRQKIAYSSYESSAPIAKRNRTIKVKCANKTFKFKDSRVENEEEYFVEGSYKSWIIIKGYLYWNYEQFYMINPKTGEIDSLAGEPHFYKDKILCIEGDATDGTKMIEVWQMDRDRISLIYSTDLKRRNIFDVDDFYLLNDTVFLKSEERYLKIYYDGVSWGDASTSQGYQPFKYNGKELDRMHGLFWYDYGARRYDPTVGMFTQVDPLCEQYPHLNPYLYCAGNPVRYVDPDGRHIKVKKDKEKEGLYTILGGEVDDDLNIYDVSNGWENRISIGKALTQFSFFNDDGKPVEGSIINLNDKSGLVFWSNFEKWAAVMPLGYYVLNAYPGNKYDFKQKDISKHKDIDVNQYNNRGMKVNLDGSEYIASARDIGNYAAGYYAGLIGLTWQESRFGFDALETIDRLSLRTEGMPSQSAQSLGFSHGNRQSPSVRRIITNYWRNWFLHKIIVP